MPKKPTTTRDAMIEGAFQLIREKGHESLTARNLAAFLGCSTQPIMYQFPNLDMLRDLVYQKADAFHSEYILADAIYPVCRRRTAAVSIPFSIRPIFGIASGRFDQSPGSS